MGKMNILFLMAILPFVLSLNDVVIDEETKKELIQQVKNELKEEIRHGEEFADNANRMTDALFGFLARMSNATEEKARIKAEIKEELTSELISIANNVSNPSNQNNGLMGEAIITRNECNDAAKFQSLNRIEFFMEYYKNKDCYAEITFPHEIDFKLSVLNFKVRNVRKDNLLLPVRGSTNLAILLNQTGQP